MVDTFQEAGLAAGGRDNGPPGERPYHPGYYVAFLLDPAGKNIEAVHHGLHAAAPARWRSRSDASAIPEAQAISSRVTLKNRAARDGLTSGARQVNRPAGHDRAVFRAQDIRCMMSGDASLAIFVLEVPR